MQNSKSKFRTSKHYIRIHASIPNEMQIEANIISHPKFVQETTNSPYTGKELASCCVTSRHDLTVMMMAGAGLHQSISRQPIFYFARVFYFFENQEPFNNNLVPPPMVI